MGGIFLFIYIFMFNRERVGGRNLYAYFVKFNRFKGGGGLYTMIQGI